MVASGSPQRSRRRRNISLLPPTNHRGPYHPSRVWSKYADQSVRTRSRSPHCPRTVNTSGQPITAITGRCNAPIRIAHRKWPRVRRLRLTHHVLLTNTRPAQMARCCAVRRLTGVSCRQHRLHRAHRCRVEDLPHPLPPAHNLQIHPFAVEIFVIDMLPDK